ncbi:STAS domain-containing protein [Kibdelosporangium philippinense]|uniref:STAS domain-containing protein n=1 Tax=Kibdelosporangium philippinense TaxID=211113 RepID=UPI0035E7DCFC
MLEDIEGAIVLVVTAELDLATAPPLDRAMVATLNDSVNRLLVVDLSGHAFLASAWMSAHLKAQQMAEERHVTMRFVVSPARPACRVREIAGLSGVLGVYPTVAAAVGE